MNHLGSRQVQGVPTVTFFSLQSNQDWVRVLSHETRKYLDRFLVHTIPASALNSTIFYANVRNNGVNYDLLPIHTRFMPYHLVDDDRHTCIRAPGKRIVFVLFLSASEINEISQLILLCTSFVYEKQFNKLIWKQWLTQSLSHRIRPFESALN